MRNNLLKKEVRVVPTLELAIRFNRLMQMGEAAPVHVATMADARETLWIEEELRRRLLKAIGHDFYPPDRPTTACVKPAIKIKFAVIVTNSLGSKAAQFTVEADTKDKADILARKMVRKLGLKGATYKLS